MSPISFLAEAAGLAASGKAFLSKSALVGTERGIWREGAALDLLGGAERVSPRDLGTVNMRT